MNIIILLGPPGVGKLTVANELTKLRKIALFDNHQVIDMVEPIVTREYKGFGRLVYDTQLKVIEAAAEYGEQDIVFTFAFSIDETAGIELLRSIEKIGENYSARIHLIYLSCDQAELERRVLELSRHHTHGKIKDMESLRKLADQYDLKTPPQGENVTIIDTTTVSAQETAKQIEKVIYS